MKLKRIVLDRHYGFCGDSESKKGRYLQNGETGIAFDKKRKQSILVSTCWNCGNYQRLDIESIIKELVLNSWISLSSLLFEVTKEDV